jgi:hypothetical protein
MRPAIRYGTGILLLLAAGCSSGSDATGPNSGCGNGGSTSGLHLTATINGACWVSNAGAESIGVQHVLPGVYTLSGSQVGGLNPYIINISLYNIRGPGTYPLGVGPTVPGGYAIVSNTAGGWSTPQSGADGTITFTALTDTHMTGTFSFVADSSLGAVHGPADVENGDFDVNVHAQGAIGPVPDNAGSVVTATVGGASWNAAAVAATYSNASGTGHFVIASNNSTSGLGISISGITGPGTYAFGANGALTVGNTVATLSHTWSTLGAGGGGTLTITSITSTRVKGSFSATLGPAPGLQTTGTLTVTDGTFDVGLP